MSFGDLTARLERTQSYDIAMRLPIAVYSWYVLVNDVMLFYRQVAEDPVALAHADIGSVVAVLARLSQWMFVMLMAVLPLFRHRPIAKSTNILPRLGALATVCVPLLCLQLDRAPPNLVFDLISVIVGLSANVLAAVSLSFLGRSFSVMPEARRLVTDGPYGIVRHPLYVFEILGVVAMVMQMRSLPALALLALVIALQVMRARWEEQVLETAFPEFAAYRRQVPFLIPRNPRDVLAMMSEDSQVRQRSVLIIGSSLSLLVLMIVVLPRLAG